jgi:hypothetical protein
LLAADCVTVVPSVSLELMVRLLAQMKMMDSTTTMPRAV